MKTQAAYDKAVQALCRAAELNHTDELGWLSTAVQLMWDRLVQEGIAREMDAFSPQQVAQVVCSREFTIDAIKKMKRDMDRFGSIYRSEVIAGIGSKTHDSN